MRRGSATKVLTSSRKLVSQGCLNCGGFSSSPSLYLSLLPKCVCKRCMWLRVVQAMVMASTRWWRWSSRAFFSFSSLLSLCSFVFVLLFLFVDVAQSPLVAEFARQPSGKANDTLVFSHQGQQVAARAFGGVSVVGQKTPLPTIFVFVALHGVFSKAPPLGRRIGIAIVFKHPSQFGRRCARRLETLLQKPDTESGFFCTC